jgi:hypothetical protein
MADAGRLKPRWSSLPDDGDRLDEAAPPSVRRLAVVGAGQMGAGAGFYSYDGAAPLAPVAA